MPMLKDSSNAGAGFGRLFLPFLDYPEVSSDNNHAEREIRLAVIMRKNCQGNWFLSSFA